jgi:5-formyltetrahydrofolate cyclo-ligase
MDGPIDIIIMPGLGFDNKCHRLGRGKGYYDSYIRVLREQTMTTGRQMPLLGMPQ